MAKIHQVFVGCPFLTAIRKNYDQLKVAVESESPLHVVLADTTAISSTDYLLEHITGLIRESAACIFDATGGNPNVSLEVGIAHALPAEFLLTMYTRRPRTQQRAEKALEAEGERRPIISDLQGRNRIEYKTFPSLRDQVVDRYLNRLPYMQRWVQFKKHHSSFMEPAVQLFREMRLSGRSLRPRVVAALDGTGIRANEFLDSLAEARLVTVKRGRVGGIFYPTK